MNVIKQKVYWYFSKPHALEGQRNRKWGALQSSPLYLSCLAYLTSDHRGIFFFYDSPTVIGAY